ncbi:MAG: hypothetical protein EKK33_37050 [Bradyrhizobiaceae bacterium]|nr:MAG: hypothetical protein EKK33_37050 [Bradyrhizobiaceae bacterium]
MPPAGSRRADIANPAILYRGIADCVMASPPMAGSNAREAAALAGPDGTFDRLIEFDTARFYLHTPGIALAQITKVRGRQLCFLVMEQARPSR